MEELMEKIEREIKEVMSQGFDRYDSMKILMLSYALCLASLVDINANNFTYKKNDALWYSKAIRQLSDLSTQELLKGGEVCQK